MTRRRTGGREDDVATPRSSSRSTTSNRRADRDAVDDQRGVVARVSRRTLRRVAWPLVLAVMLCATLAIGVFPTRTYFEKRQAVSLAQERVDNLTRENDEKQARVDLLQTDAEIEAIARGEYNLVKPGEESYEVLPPPQEPVQLPDAWPFNQLEKDLDSTPG